MPVVTDGSGRPLVVTIQGHPRSIGHRRRGVQRITRGIDAAFLSLYVLLAGRLLLAFFHADTGNGLIGIFATVTNLLYAPFRHLSRSRDIAGQFTLEVPIILAIVAYVVVHLLVLRVVHVIGERRRAQRTSGPELRD